MLRRRLAAAVIMGALGGAIAGASSRAEAAGGWIAGASFAPVEQRVAIASSAGGRTTLWTSLRFSSGAGKLAIVIPAPPGTVLDFSSDAWFEALEVATAPRIFPPAGPAPYCPGKSGPPDVFQLEGQVAHMTSLAPQDFAVLDSAQQVSTWAAKAGLALSPTLAQNLNKMSGVRFVAARFDTSPGAGVTPTLRLVMPSAPAELPLLLTEARADDLRVTAWLIGPGRGDLLGATEVAVSPVTWNVATQSSDYDELLHTALASDGTRFLVEASGHGPLADTQLIAEGTATIDSAVSTYFERAAQYGDGSFDAASCVSTAELALASASPVAEACPFAALGTLDPQTACTESPKPSETDPASLRCGPHADDLAVALSGLAPQSATLTRQALVIPAGSHGLTWPLGFQVGGALQSPVLYSSAADLKECHVDGGASSSSSGSASSSSSSSSSGHGGVIHDVPGDSSGGYSGDGFDVDLETVFDATPDVSCDCSGSSASYDTSGDSCSSSDGTGDSCSSSDGSGYDGDTCSSSEAGSDSCSGSSSSDACSGSSSSEACSGGGGEACSGGGGSSCSGGGGSFDCTTARSGRPRGPKFSILMVSLLAVLAPLRRLGRKRRDAERQRAAR
jgi:hypothetical protein